MANFIKSLQAHAKTIVADLLTVAGVVGAALALAINNATALHIPGNVVAILVIATSVVATVVLELRRIAGETAAAKKAE